jgi:hypothetical protein
VPWPIRPRRTRRWPGPCAVLSSQDASVRRAPCVILSYYEPSEQA